LRAEQRLEWVERIGGSCRGCARDKKGRDRGDGLQAGKIVHDTSPFDVHWSERGGGGGQKACGELILRIGYRARIHLESLILLSLPRRGNNPVLTPVQRGRHPAQRRHDTVAHSGLGSHCLAACQPTTASATASVDAK